jgi:hypothetical protein
MKKSKNYVMAFVMLLALIPTQLRAESASVVNLKELRATSNDFSKEKIKVEESAEATAMLNRLNEIKAMDKSNMSSREKKELRKEVRTLKTNMAQLSGGVYLSAGAIIVILLLLIILL